jgi:hypothetical protein
MEDAFPIVVWIVAAVGAIVAIYTLIGTGASYRKIGGGASYRKIGGGGIARDEGGGGALDTEAERDVEIRQMLAGRNARRAGRGEAPQDVEAEFAALTRPPAEVDAELCEEMRQHVLARNARRVRAGDAALDVEQEIVRRIRKLS